MDQNSCTNHINDIPVFKVFQKNGHYYLYDTYTNYILSVTKEHYKELCLLQKTGMANYLDSKICNDAKTDIILLLKKGMLRCNFIEKIEHPLTTFVPLLATSCLNEIIFQVTQDCNFNCRYCSFATNNGFDHIHNKNEMTWEIAKKSLDYLYDHSYNSHEISIYFYGGEPLLNFKLIKEIVRYSKEIFKIKNVKYSMTINGSILTEEMASFFIKNDFHIAISFDGDKTTQNKHRKFAKTGEGTYQAVCQNVEMLRQMDEIYFQRQVVVMPVVFDDEDFNNVRNFFFSIGIKNITPLNVNLRGIDYKHNISAFVMGSRLSPKKDGEGINDISADFDKVYRNKTKINSIWHHNGPCVAGITRLFVDIYGRFYPCEKACENDAVLIGNVNEGLKHEKIAALLNIGNLSVNRCKSCWAMRFCNLCVEQCYDYEKSEINDSTKELFCNAQKQNILDYFYDYLNQGVGIYESSIYFI